MIRHSIVVFGILFAAAASAQTAEPIQNTAPMSQQHNAQMPGQPGIYVQLPMQDQQNASNHAPAQDPTAYCYYADRSYSEGSRLRDQVCVRPGNTGGGYEASTQLAPLKWVSASQYARGRY